jgi:transposase-like protein
MEEKYESQNLTEITDQAALWNQHEICPECKSGDIQVIDYLVHDLFKSHHEYRYKCRNCGCTWL